MHEKPKMKKTSWKSATNGVFCLSDKVQKADNGLKYNTN